jgi:hypothetical protein
MERRRQISLGNLGLKTPHYGEFSGFYFCPYISSSAGEDNNLEILTVRDQKQVPAGACSIQPKEQGRQK